MTIKAISLFAGAGGDTLGMVRADVDVVGYVEYDKHAIETHAHNFPSCQLIGEDITSISDADIEAFGRNHGPIQLIFGGFPCQTFSHGGKKDPGDERGQLYKHFVRFARILKPRAIIGENVAGLLHRTTSEGAPFIDTIARDFSDAGYTIQYETIDTVKFGLPQSRKRVIIVGTTSRDTNITKDIASIDVGYRKYNKDVVYPSLKNALCITDTDILNVIPSDGCVVCDNTARAEGNPPTNLVKCYNKIDNHGLSYGKRARSTFSCIIDLNDVARTIQCTYSRMPRLFVPVKRASDGAVFLRPYTVLELQRIQGFPDDFEFRGSELKQITQIGNAVPPAVVQEVVRTLIRANVFETRPPH